MIGVYFGETQCEGVKKKGLQRCVNVAYYRVGNRYFCGVHSKKEMRVELPKNPDADKIKAEKIKQHLLGVVVHDRGVVTATKMRMMQTPQPKEGFMPIFPNNKHGHGYGYGAGDFSYLSPMKLGPIYYDIGDGSGSFILAKNIENYHQFAKVFPCELSNEPCDCGRPFAHNKPLDSFYETRKKGYADSVPHRHKFDSKELKKQNKEFVNGNVNIPMYSVQYVCGEERHYTYLESRYFYCNQMELLASETASLAKLRALYKQGYWLEIFGYDAYEPTTDLYTHYCDESRPFGHEMVILALVRGEYYPWRTYRANHPEIYNSPFPQSIDISIAQTRNNPVSSTPHEPIQKKPKPN